MKKILAAVDGSQPSGRAVRMAADLAVHFGAELTLVTVLGPLWIPPAVGSDVVEQIIQDRLTEANRLLAEAEKALEEPGLDVKRMVLEGAVAESLDELASAGQFDLVVIGSRGRGTPARVLLGSVSDRLAHICKQPILIVR